MKKVIYTAIIDNYDELKTPSEITEGWDYVCFTNNPNLKSKIWRIELIKNNVYSNTLMARSIKIAYYNYVSDYDMSIWVDASVKINCNLNKFIFNNFKYIKDANFITLKHPHRTSILEEALVCVERAKTKKDIAQKQLLEYYNNDYEFNNGLVATGLIIREHTRINKSFCINWMQEVLKHSKRDQLSFNYVLFKHKIKFATLPFDVLSNEFILKPHKY